MMKINNDIVNALKNNANSLKTKSKLLKKMFNEYKYY